MEQGPLQTTTRVETRREVVRTECPAERCACALQKNSNDKKAGEAYLYKRQCCLEPNHPEEPSTAL